MTDFQNYLENEARGCLPEQYRTNMIFIMLMRVLREVVTGEYDALVLSNSEIVAYKLEKSRTLRDIAGHENRTKTRKNVTSYLYAMRKIVETDEQIRQHFQLIEDLPESLTYRVIRE